MRGKSASVLVVEADDDTRERIAGRLEQAGLDVLSCPGPSAPDYRCVAGRGGRCALATAADVVVLDLWLTSDTVMEGTSSDELLSYYTGCGKPVIALTRAPRGLPQEPEGEVSWIRWPAPPGVLVEAARRLAPAEGDERP